MRTAVREKKQLKEEKEAKKETTEGKADKKTTDEKKGKGGETWEDPGRGYHWVGPLQGKGRWVLLPTRMIYQSPVLAEIFGLYMTRTDSDFTGARPRKIDIRTEEGQSWKYMGTDSKSGDWPLSMERRLVIGQFGKFFREICQLTNHHRTKVASHHFSCTHNVAGLAPLGWG